MCLLFPDSLGTTDSLTLAMLPINYYLTTGRHHATGCAKISILAMIISLDFQRATPQHKIAREILKQRDGDFLAWQTAWLVNLSNYVGIMIVA